VLAIVLIFTTFIVWLVTFTPVFIVIDRLVLLTDLPNVANIIKLCNIAAGCCLLCEVISYLIWALASAFKRETQTYYGGFVDE
jgi:hypothetical protein